MKPSTCIAIILVIAFDAGCSQQPSERNTISDEKKIGGRCEGCEAIYEYGDKKLSWVDTLADYNNQGPKLEISGTIYLSDGKTPAKDVILYIYHTNQEGVYETNKNSRGWEKRHGFIRGWIKTNADGKYKFLTLRPGAYPKGNNPQHIHPVIKEPNSNEYWIDEFLFADDPILKKVGAPKGEKRGGSGLITLTKRTDGVFEAKRDIVLGLNVPDYK
jgi:protocatechuate 3,4-dioxygenase beta subunit